MQVTQILITSNSSPPQGTVQSCINSVKRYFPDLPHILYSDQKIQELIKEHYSEDVLSAYQKLKPFAYKSDLARLCIVNIKGGWYFDLGIFCVGRANLPSNIQFLAFRDTPLPNAAPWACCNGAFYAQPGHEILQRAIRLIVDNCEHEYHGINPLCPTGPYVWGQAIAMTKPAPFTLFGDFIELTPAHPIKNRAVVLPNGKIIAYYKPIGVQGARTSLEQLGVKGCNDYSKMWHDKEVYSIPKQATIDVE